VQIADFPQLPNARYRITSPPDVVYNCVAWAAKRDQANWWQPGSAPYYYWPVLGAPRSQAIDLYLEAFHLLGFRVCRSSRGIAGWQVVAFYTDGRGKFLHVAAHLADDVWTSKLGQAEDIEHHTLHALEGGKYGQVTHFMRRLDPHFVGMRRLIARLTGLVIR
jgi:hypothetical protein